MTRRRCTDRRGSALLEAVVCLTVIALVCTSFGDFAAGAAATDAELAERARARRVLSGVEALLGIEDPWVGPETRSYAVDPSGAPVPSGPGTFDVRVAGSALCEGGEMPADNALAPPPGGCTDGRRAVRRWQIEVSYPASFREGGRDTLRSTLDVDRSPGSAGWTATGVLP